jgi:general secretion pathway protein J
MRRGLNQAGQAGQAGFTLLEILIAMVVLGFVMAGLVAASRFGISAWNLQTRLVDRSTEMERVDRILRLLVEQAAPPLAADDKLFSGQEHRLEFITRLPFQPQTDPIRRAQVALGVDSKHRLLLRWVPKPNAVSLLASPPAPQEIVLAEGVDHLDVTYRQATGDGGKWMRTWDDTPLPALVVMHIVMVNSHEHWPAIQAATMLDTNGSF